MAEDVSGERAGQVPPARDGDEPIGVSKPAQDLADLKQRIKSTRAALNSVRRKPRVAGDGG
jgi:hypothetical protein